MLSRCLNDRSEAERGSGLQPCLDRLGSDQVSVEALVWPDFSEHLRNHVTGGGETGEVRTKTDGRDVIVLYRVLFQMSRIERIQPEGQMVACGLRTFSIDNMVLACVG